MNLESWKYLGSWTRLQRFWWQNCSKYLGSTVRQQLIHTYVYNCIYIYDTPPLELKLNRVICPKSIATSNTSFFWGYHIYIGYYIHIIIVIDTQYYVMDIYMYVYTYIYISSWKIWKILEDSLSWRIWRDAWCDHAYQVIMSLRCSQSMRRLTAHPFFISDPDGRWWQHFHACSASLGQGELPFIRRRCMRLPSPWCGTHIGAAADHGFLRDWSFQKFPSYSNMLDVYSLVIKNGWKIPTIDSWNMLKCSDMFQCLQVTMSFPTERLFFPFLTVFSIPR